MINKPRMQLRCWEQADREAFAAMHADPEVMHDYGGSISRSESDAKFDRYEEVTLHDRLWRSTSLMAPCNLRPFLGV
jgi:hypothetical protein